MSPNQPRVWRILGIPLHIHNSWYFTALLITWSLATSDYPFSLPGYPVVFYWALGAVAAVLLFVCVVLHELGHSIVARWFGIPVHQVTLFIFGGVAQIGQEAKRPLVELLVALAGPLVSFVLAALFIYTLGILPRHSSIADVAHALLSYLFRVNAGILLFNLLPGFPLDGGRVLRAALWALLRNVVLATKIASAAGVALGLGLILLGVWTIVVQRSWSSGIWSILLGAYLQSTAHSIFRRTLPLH